MKIIFFGTSEFGVPALEVLLNSRHEVASAVTQPRKQKGRGLKLLPTPIEAYARKHNLKLLQFEDVNSKEAVDALRSEGAEICVIAAFGQILSRELLTIPGFYFINIHASLLPHYRGAAPIQRAIINGDTRTGITIMRVSEPLDSGDIITQQEIEISGDEDSLSLSRRLSVIGSQLLVKVLDSIESGNVEFRPQDESKATYAAKIRKEDGLIDWNRGALSIRDKVRGCYPWPSGYTYLDGKLLKILDVDIAAEVEGAKPGSIIDADEQGILVACKKSAILIKRLQLEGKRELAAAEFLRGRPIKIKNTCLGS